MKVYAFAVHVDELLDALGSPREKALLTQLKRHKDFVGIDPSGIDNLKFVFRSARGAVDGWKAAQKSGYKTAMILAMEGDIK